MSERAEIGSITWRDLTVPDADAVRNFYRDVVGWTFSSVDMGAYSDYCMNAPESGTTLAGICHSRGTNADLPLQWLMYITVEDVEASAAKVRELGGEVIVPVRELGSGRFCVIKDPAGAVAALFTEES